MDAPKKHFSFLSVLESLNQGIDKIVILVLSALLVITVYSIWNIYLVFAGAAVDAKVVGYKPSGADNALGFSELRAINKDIVGWITVDDTHIDYPVLQSDDNATYLNRDVYGNYAVSGSIFMDYKNARDFSDFYTVIYGHHMDKGAMFGDIDKFISKDFFETHQTGTLYVEDEELKLDIVACVESDGYDKHFYNVNYLEKAAKNEFISYIKDNATNVTDFNLGGSDTLIAMSTCSTATTDGRIILIAVVHN